MLRGEALLRHFQYSVVIQNEGKNSLDGYADHLLHILYPSYPETLGTVMFFSLFSFMCPYSHPR